MKNTVEAMLQFYAQIRRFYITEFTWRFQEETFSPNELNLMLFLHNNPSINTASQLCTCLNVSKALICRSVRSLTQQGYLTAPVRWPRPQNPASVSDRKGGSGD